MSVFMDAENQTKTPVVADNLNPKGCFCISLKIFRSKHNRKRRKWEHVDYFRVYREDDDVQFSVFDSDIDKDDPLGNYHLALGHIDDDWLDWLDQRGLCRNKLQTKPKKRKPGRRRSQQTTNGTT